MKKDEIIKILKLMNQLFPSNKTELHYETPFQLLMAVMLSAQTKDSQVNIVTSDLFKFIKVPSDLLNLGLENFEKSIMRIGLYKTKARNIFNTSQILSKTGGSIPDNLEKLLELPGVGIKTAKVVLHVLYGARYIAVDTHVFRVANRIGIVDEKDPKKVSECLEKMIPNEYKDIAHHSMILFGRYHCTARNPKCNECPLTKYCKYYAQNNG